MNIEMTLPDISTTGSSVRIIQWLIEPGQEVKRGQLLLEVETDKSVMEVESYMDGVLFEILVQADSEVEVGQAIALITTPDASHPGEYSASAEPESTQPVSSPSTLPQVPEPAPDAGPPVRMSMFARNRQKLDQESPKPAETLPSVPASTDLAEILPQSAAQRVVAQRMFTSKQTIPHFYLQASANAEAPAVRRNASPDEKPSWDAFFVYAVGKALKKYPRMCASYIDGQPIRRHRPAAISSSVRFPAPL